MGEQSSGTVSGGGGKLLCYIGKPEMWVYENMVVCFPLLLWNVQIKWYSCATSDYHKLHLQYGKASYRSSLNNAERFTGGSRVNWQDLCGNTTATKRNSAALCIYNLHNVRLRIINTALYYAMINYIFLFIVHFYVAFFLCWTCFIVFFSYLLSKYGCKEICSSWFFSFMSVWLNLPGFFFYSPSLLWLRRIFRSLKNSVRSLKDLYNSEISNNSMCKKFLNVLLVIAVILLLQKIKPTSSVKLWKMKSSILFDKLSILFELQFWNSKELQHSLIKPLIVNNSYIGLLWTL